MTELYSLMETVDSWPIEPSLFVTSRQIWATELEQLGRTYVVGECDRNKPLHIIATFIRSVIFAIKERPDVIVTTGSLPIAIVCLVCKLFGTKIVWIDSVAQIDELSLSGKLVKKIASVFIVQWPEVAAKHPKAEYVGELL